MIKVLSIFGTRPEAIKMAPVVKELEKHADRIESRICVTAQHREMLDQMLRLFEITADLDLDIMQPNQSLSALTSRLFKEVDQVLKSEQPDLILVQGDTTTVMVSSVAAFYHGIRVGHVEAGLRSGDRRNPFPEELNRRITSLVGDLHFAPTETAADALRKEGADSGAVFLTGNTVIDALRWVIDQGKAALPSSIPENNGLKTILVTAHRRENFGEPLERICSALQEIVERNPETQVIYPVHRNPRVRETVYSILEGRNRVHLPDPVEYHELVGLLQSAHLVLTDSGGIQEEAPALGKPVLVLREETERPEGVEAGTAKLVGTDRRKILEETERLLNDDIQYQQMSQAGSPYGDGKAAIRIVSAILDHF